DANIILGATYDANMNGSIRVSVVATGTDATMVQALEPMKANSSRAPLAVKRPQVQLESQPQQSTAPEFETQVEQAVAEAISHAEELPQDYSGDDGVTVEPYIPASSHE